ncbi:CTR copper uptake transporter [Mycena vulgaris]|nr:CTR copper uptake transporter [Mycena vulgaris]
MSPHTMSALLPLLVIAFALAPCALAVAANGMDMSMDDGMSLASGTMLTYLHFSVGDTLWFAGWVPQSAGAQAGACIGLFLLALLERWGAAVRGMVEARWRAEARAWARKCDEKNGGRKGRLQAPPFNLARDGARGAMHALQALVGFAFMLAVMTFQAAFIIAIVLGLGVGEMLFGRYGAAAAH